MTQDTTKIDTKDIVAGFRFVTIEGCVAEVLSVRNSREVEILFINTGNTKVVAKDLIQRQSIKNPMHPSMCGVGYLGIGEYSTKGNKAAYDKWRTMLKRCYGNSAKEAYKNVTVRVEWHNFQNFAHWFYEDSNHQDGWEIDKDILGDGSMEYAPDNCLFIPKDANTAYQNGIDSIELPPSEISKKDPELAKAIIARKQLGELPIDEALRLKKFIKLRATRYLLIELEADHPLILKAIAKLDEKELEVNPEVVRVFTNSDGETFVKPTGHNV
ncbi:hypothetical protein [Thiomicrorhabdus sediminis]|uniref:Uncharacterized protein n=1 Tax=Thiomicrorhabdus sediminis TaxID=2580412 RepID=A0A4P9K6N5_9GAMM|nr:hypothetical protein [Thiomicrorhabdus sediminis]QCU90548.1 hypothetical protein FE785_07830 [Thiomicrorhabdus sediminis]